MPKLPSMPPEAKLADLFARHPSHAPELIGLVESVMRGDGALDIGERELISAFVSSLNACSYCLGSHLIFAEAMGVPPERLEALLNDDTETTTAKDRALYSYLRKLTEAPADLRQSDMQAMLEEGWREDEIVEAIHVASLFNMMNRIVEGTGVDFDTAGNRTDHVALQPGTDARQHSYLGLPASKG